MSMKADRRSAGAVAVVLAVLALCGGSALGLIQVGRGSAPVTDQGWPEGCFNLANLATRIGWWEGPPFGGGETHLEYHCERTEGFAEALDSFSEIASGRLELFVHNGPKRSEFFSEDGEKARVDWEFTVWNPDNWRRLFQEPNNLFMSDSANFRKPLPAPRMDVYIGGGGIVWEEVKVAKNITVIDKRPSSVGKEFAGKGLVRARVADMSSGKPIKGARIVLTASVKDEEEKILTGQMDEKGYCQMDAIPVGYHYRVIAEAEGYARRHIGYYDNELAEFYEFETRLSPESSISGVVVEKDGAPVVGATVQASAIVGTDGFGYVAVDKELPVTDEKGRFVLETLPKGKVHLSCSAEGLHMVNSIFEVYEVPSENVRIVMGRVAHVFGKVRGEEGKRPAGEFIVELNPAGGNRLGTWGGSMKLSEDGTFEIKGIPPGDYVLSVMRNPGRSDIEPDKKSVSVEAGKTYEVDLTYTGR